MAEPNWTEVATALATIVGATAALVTTGIAAYAAVTWKNTLKNQRADECIAAARDLIGAVNRCLDVKKRINLGDQKPVYGAYDEAWTSWRRFDQAFYPARRYYRYLDIDLPKSVANDVDKLKYFFDGDWSDDSANYAGAQKARSAIESQLKTLEKL